MENHVQAKLSSIHNALISINVKKKKKKMLWSDKYITKDENPKKTCPYIQMFI